MLIKFTNQKNKNKINFFNIKQIMSFTNILNISIVVLVILLILYYLLFSKKEGLQFYQVEDVDGQKGFIHDRGNNYSKIYFLLKEEIQNNEKIKINEPKKIYVGGNPKDLKEKTILSVEDNGLYYKVDI